MLRLLPFSLVFLPFIHTLNPCRFSENGEVPLCGIVALPLLAYLSASCVVNHIQISDKHKPYPGITRYSMHFYTFYTFTLIWHSLTVVPTTTMFDTLCVTVSDTLPYIRVRKGTLYLSKGKCIMYKKCCGIKYNALTG